jgi:hypothetical protein
VHLLPLEKVQEQVLEYVQGRAEEEVPLLVTLQDLVNDWRWDKNVLPLLALKRRQEEAQGKEKEKEGERKGERMKERRFVPRVELKAGVTLTFSLLSLPSTTHRNYITWETSSLQFHHPHVLRFFGLAPDPTHAGKNSDTSRKNNILVYESVPAGTLTLKYILKSLMVPEKPSDNKIHSTSCPSPTSVSFLISPGSPGKKNPRAMENNYIFIFIFPRNG